MKKALIAVVSLALAISIAVTVSAAELSSNWREAAPYTAQGHEPGFVDVSADGEIVLDTTGGNNYLHSGVIYGEKVKVDGLVTDIEVDGLAVEIAGSSLGYGFGILLSAAEIGDFAAYTDQNNIMTGNTMCPKCDTGKTAGYFFCLKDSDSFGVFGGIASLTPVRYGNDIPAVPIDEPLRVAFTVEEGKIVMTVNGEKLSALNVDASEVLDEDGKAYFSIFDMGLGWAGAIVTIKSVNGFAANDFSGGEYVEPASSEPVPSEPASSEPVNSDGAPSEAAPAASCGNRA